MRDLYAHFVLTLIGPALALRARQEHERWQAAQHAAAIARDQQIKARCACWQAERARRPSREPDDAVDHWVRVYEDALGVDPRTHPFSHGRGRSASFISFSIASIVASLAALGSALAMNVIGRFTQFSTRH